MRVTGFIFTFRQKMASLESIEKELTCAICADFYTNPKGLPCLHTFCRDCLKSHIMTQTDKRHITCPMCRKVISVPEDKARSELVDVFPTNHNITSIMDIVVPKTEQHICKICQERGVRQKAIKHCHICNEDLCGDCAQLHALFNATKNHALNDLVAKTRKSEETPVKNRSHTVHYTINVSHSCKVNGRTDTDDEPSYFTGVIFLEDDRIVAADNNNYKIKLFESDGKFVTEICQVRPFGLTLVSQTDIAITECGSVKFFVVQPNKIKIEKSYNFEWKIFTPSTLQISTSALGGLHYNNGQFVACSRDDKDKHITIFDKAGHNQRHIWKDEHFYRNVFQNPWYCCFSDDLTEVYVSDGIGVSGCVICMSIQGQKKWEYRCEMPRGIVTLGDYILFADWRKDEITVQNIFSNSSFLILIFYICS